MSIIFWPYFALVYSLSSHPSKLFWHPKIYNYSEPYKIAFCECQHTYRTAISYDRITHGQNRNSSSQNGFHPRVPPPPFPAAIFSGRSYVFLLTGSKNNGCNVIAWFNLLCMIHFLLWKSFYPLSAPQAEYTPYRFTNLIYFSEKHRSKKHPDAIPAPPEFQGAMTQPTEK